jgi:hypothetical protein
MEFVEVINSAASLVSLGIDKLALLLTFFVVYKVLANKESALAFVASMRGEKTGVNDEESLKLILPILSQITESIEKVSGNDLNHIQGKIDLLNDCLVRRMDNFDDKLMSHDKQAIRIKDTCDNIWNKINQK